MRLPITDNQLLDGMVLVFAGILTMTAIANAFSGPDDLEMQRREYCEMVKLYQDTRGEYGWPDFKQTAGRDCK